MIYRYMRMDAYIILDERDLANNNNNNVLFVSLETFCKYSFPHFPVSSSIKKIGQWKTIFGQRKTLIKIRLIFYKLFSKKFFQKTISLSCVTSPIDIIFVYNRGKHNFLAPSLSHGKFSHFFSFPFTFSLLTPSPSLTMFSPLPINLSLFNCLYSFFSLCFSSLL